MSLRVLVVPDKFKGTLTAHAAAAAIARGWRRARTHDRITLLPMSDGGDGFGEILSAQLKARAQTIATLDAAHRPLESLWWWEPKSKTAIIESAKIIGLALLPPGKFHPFALDTFGLGAALQAATKKGARRILIGIGGSATNDAGFGVARALGWQFFDKRGLAIERWTGLHRLASVVPPRQRLFRELIVAVDVQNPLLGAHGCSRVYGPQKGLRTRDMIPSERNLRRLADVLEGEIGNDYCSKAGAGAAGGLGFGLRSFFGARLAPGFDLFAKHAKLEEHLRSTSLVITGEGALDKSTLMGKGVGEIARRAKRMKLPCVGLGGAVNDRAQVLKLFAQAHALAPDLASVDEAKARPAFWLEELAARVAADWH